jgi:hypothetical protein
MTTSRSANPTRHTPGMEPSVVEAVTGLTRRWVATLPADDDWVVSGLGAWAVLAPVLAGASGRARRELEGALAVSGDEAGPAATAMHASIGATAGLWISGGLWTRPGLDPKREFVESVAPMVVDTFPEDRTAFDDWVRDATAGILKRFPMDVDPESLMVLASVVAAAAPWSQPFVEGPDRWLSQTRFDLDSAAILRSGDASTIRVVCRTRSEFDVHLVVGRGAESPATVLGLGLAAHDGRTEVVPGSKLRTRHGGGPLTVTMERRPDGPVLEVSTPAFDIASDHDLLEQHELFGLSAARDATIGHFPGICDAALAVESAAQSAVARFTAAGFEAASATAIGLQVASAPARVRRVRVVRVVFDRPFGFLAVQRESGVACFAGWVAGAFR